MIRSLTVTDAEALESATAARVAQEKAAKAQAAQEAKEEAAAEAAMLAQGKSAPAIATKVQVYSRSQGQWLPGLVVAVEGVEAKVNYKSRGQIGEKWVYWAVRAPSSGSSPTACAASTRLRKPPAAAVGAGTVSSVDEEGQHLQYAAPLALLAAGRSFFHEIAHTRGVAASGLCSSGQALVECRPPWSAYVPRVLPKARTVAGARRKR